MTSNNGIVIDEFYGQKLLTSQHFRQWMRTRTNSMNRSGMSYVSLSTSTIARHAPDQLSKAVKVEICKMT
jgi:hypothetical protein